MIDSVYRAVERHPRDLMFATSVADIRRAKRQEDRGVMGIEGGHAIEDSLPTLRAFYRLGVRYMTLTWNNTNNWADAGRGREEAQRFERVRKGSRARDESFGDAD